METMTVPGAEKQIDELSKRVDFGFAEQSKCIDFGFDQTNQRLGRVEDDVRQLRAEMKAGFDGIQRLMTRFFAGTLGTIVAGVIVSAILSHF
jgi:tetrahydromethanopterin S-methyltransferase subunit G